MNQIKILLIEDNPADARLIKESLRDALDNFHLEWKEGLFAGLAYLARTDVDVILVDLNLPDSQGRETFTKINAKFPDKPIIVLTGLNDNELAYRVVREGAQDYLIKGEMDGALLDRSIRYSIERKKSETALREAEQAKQAAQARNAQYEQAVSMISDIVWRYDLNTKGEHVGSYISPVADRMLGLPIGTIGDSFEKYFSYVHPDDLPAMQKTLFEVIQTLGKDKTAEYRLRKADGTTLWVRSNFSAYGQFNVFGTTSDITERKQAEAELREKEEKYRLLIENIHDIIYTLTPDGVFTFVSPGWTTLLGHQVTEVTGKSFQQFIHPDDIARCMVFLRALNELGQRQTSIKYRVQHADGTWRWHNTNAVPLRDEAGTVIGFEGIATDITERMQMEDLLKQTRHNYETFFNTINDFLFVLDEQGNIVHTNDTVIDRLGYTREELFGKSVLMVHPPERRDEAGRIVGEMLSGIAEFCPVPIITKSGVQIPVETRVSGGFWDGKPAIFGVTKDISKIKLSEEKFSKLFHINPSACGLSGFDDHKYIEVNEAFYTLLGFDKNEVIGKTAIDLGILTTETRNAILLKTDINGNVTNAEANLKAKNGDIKHVLLSAENINVQNKKYRFTIVHDITERVRAEEALRESEERFRTIFENNSAAMAIIERDKTISKVNKEYCKLGLFEEKDVIGISWTSQIPPEDLGRLLEYNRNRLIDPKNAPDKYEFMFYRKDGKIRHCLMSVAMIPTSQQIVCSFTDITERKQAEEALHESEAMVRKKLVAILEPEGDIGMLNLADILDIQAIQSLMDDFYRLTQIGIAIIDVHGKVLVAVGWQDVCTKFHRVHPDTLKNCQESDVILTRGVPMGTFKAYHCKNNLWDMATPIEVGGRHLGNVFFGQLFYEDVIPDYELFRSFARQHGFDETEYLAALDRVPRWNRETVDAIMAFYAKLAGMISSMSYNVVSLSRAISQNELALRQLGESEEKYRLLINNANESIIVAQDGLLKFVNPMTLDLLEDYSEQELIDRPFPEFIHPDDRNMVVENYRRRIANEAVLPRYAFRVVTRGGIVKWVEINATLIEWQGKPATLNFLTDINERMRAEKEVQALKTQMEFILGATKTGLDIIDAKFNIHYIDPEWKKVYGDYAGRKCYQYFMDRNTPCPDCGMVKALQTKSIIVTEEVLLKENSRPIQVTTIPFQNDAGEWLVAEVNVDIAERKQAEESLRAAFQIIEGIIDAIPVRVFWKDRDLVYLGCNAIFARDAGYADSKDIIGKDDYQMGWRDQAELYRSDDRQVIESGCSKLLIEEPQTTPEGNPIVLLTSKIPLHSSEGEIIGVLGTYMDITERKQAEKALQESEERYRRLSEDMPVFVTTFLPDGTLTYLNETLATWDDVTPAEKMIGRNFFDLLSPAEREIVRARLGALTPEQPIETHEQRHQRPDGRVVYHEWTNRAFFNADGQPTRYQGVGMNITERKRIELAVQENEERLREVLENSLDASYKRNLLTNTYDYLSPVFAQISGYTPDEMKTLPTETVLGLMHPDDLIEVERAMAKSMSGTTGKVYHVEYRFKHKEGHYRWFQDQFTISRDASGQPLALIGSVSDITNRKHAEETLIKKSEDLASSNAELAQFAYVAAHDLQEPLRMVTSYVQLLEKRYKGNLDPDADEFIGYAVEGAKRMKQLLRDLMDCSRVSTKYRPLLNVDSETVLETALQNLKIILEETKGTVTHDPLPVIMADETQMVQLFQNLIGNGLKFHGLQPPLIHVSAKQEGTNWVFSFQDNGIGIDPQYFEKIFVIFQRLQGRDKYPGTGIGLAIAKKIVELHGGQIWVDSKPEKGATFYFTIPVDGIKDGRG